MFKPFAAAAGVLLCACLSLASAPACAAQAAIDTALPAFQIEHSFVHTLASHLLHRTYELYVKLPPGYDLPANAQKRYPVVYLNDGPYAFQVASGESRVPFTHGTFEEFILVGFSYAQGDDPVASRERDLTPYVDARPKPHATGGARAYLGFIENEAMPLLESTYRIDPARRTLVGQSYGALFGFWVLLNRAALFQNYILTSTSLWYNNGALFDAETAYSTQHQELNANVYFAVGGLEHAAPCGREAAECSGQDMVADQARMLRQLRAHHYRRLELHGRVLEGMYHTTTFPGALMWALQDLFLTHAVPRDAVR